MASMTDSELQAQTQQLIADARAGTSDTSTAVLESGDPAGAGSAPKADPSEHASTGRRTRRSRTTTRSTIADPGLTAREVQQMIDTSIGEAGEAFGEQLGAALGPISEALAGVLSKVDGSPVVPTTTAEAQALAARISASLEADRQAATVLVTKVVRDEHQLAKAEERRQELKAEEDEINAKVEEALGAMGLDASSSPDPDRNKPGGDPITVQTAVAPKPARIVVDLGEEFSPETARLLGTAVNQAADAGAQRAVDRVQPQIDAVAKLTLAMAEGSGRRGLFGRSKGPDLTDAIAKVKKESGLEPEPAPSTATSAEAVVAPVAPATTS